MRIQKRFICCAVVTAAMVMVGCVDNSKRPPTASEQQDAILKDPGAYKPSVGQNISGGDITTLDQKGINNDLDHVLNP